MSDPHSENEVIRSASAIIIRDFEIEKTVDQEQVTEQELFDLLADQVAYMIEYRLEHLFSLLYRMDVREELVRAALVPGAPEPANIGIARLVLDRQKQRNRTKLLFRQQELDEDGDW